MLATRGDAATDIVAAYEQFWHPGALAAFAAAEAQKRSKPTPPPIVYGEPGGVEYGMILNLEERVAAFEDESIWATYEQLSILGYYKAAMDEEPRQLQLRAIREILALPTA